MTQPELQSQGGEVKSGRRWPSHLAKSFGEVAIIVSDPDASFGQQLYWHSLYHSFPDEAAAFVSVHPNRRPKPLVNEYDSNQPT